LEKSKNVKHGIVKYIGKPNKDYYPYDHEMKAMMKNTKNRVYSDSGAELIEEGCVIRKRNDGIHLNIENTMHAVFANKDLFVVQRKDILYYEIA
jgi:hypothetical protein